MTYSSGDVVCVGIVEHGQVVDWSPGGREPDPVEWIGEAAFDDILRASKQSGVPILPKLNLYTQTRLSATECTRILAKWGAVEASLEGNVAEAAAIDIRRLMRICAEGSKRVELIIEGP